MHWQKHAIYKKRYIQKSNGDLVSVPGLSVEGWNFDLNLETTKAWLMKMKKLSQHFLQKKLLSRFSQENEIEQKCEIAQF